MKEKEKKPRFQRVNITRLCKDLRVSYIFADLLKQTSVESCVDYLARCGYSKKQIKENLLMHVNSLLGRMIVE